MIAPASMQRKAALVTGAASGLGRATAVALARAGADVFLVDVNADGLSETERSISETGARAEIHTADLSDPENCRASVAAAVEAFGRLDALCNVAGIIVFTHAHEMAQRDWERTIAINLSAPFYLMQAAIPHLLEQNGAIVNVASSGAFVGEAYVAAYCAAKAGVVHMTKALAMEYVHKPIRINAVAPGGMATPLGTTIRMPEDVDYELIKRFSGLRGLVEVEQVADLIAFLCSDAAQGFHGACVNIDRGITAG
jgi:NAD(P)-dependent dehydrogenase (short-subunit alcohol dehydrogenase family)